MNAATVGIGMLVVYIDVVLSVIVTTPGPVGGLLSHANASTMSSSVPRKALRMATSLSGRCLRPASFAGEGHCCSA